MDAILEPVVLFHNRDDRVISFTQSNRLYNSMTNQGMRVSFNVGDGDHGFLPDKEAQIYESLVPILKKWMEIW